MSEVDPGGASGGGADGRFATPRRLHSASILVGIDAGQLLQAGAIPLLALLGEWGRGLLVVFAALLVAGFVGRVLDWRRRTWAFDGVELRVESGILGRSLRTLDVARIQQIEIRKGLVDRLFGLAVVRVETAGSASEPEVELRVIAKEDAIALRRAVRNAKLARTAGGDAVDGDAVGRDAVSSAEMDEDSPEPGVAPPQVSHLLSIPATRIVLASITGARLLVLPALLAAATQFADDVSEEFWDRTVDGLDGFGRTAAPLVSEGPRWIWIAALFLGGTLVVATAAAVAGLVRDGGFRIDRVDGDLQVSRGLVGTRESLIPLGRVQLVAIRSNWIRRPLGFASVEVRSAGGSAGKGGSVTIPLLAISEVDRFVGEIVPELAELPRLEPHPPAALRRALFRRTTRAVLLAAALAAGAAWAGWLAGWLVAPLGGLVLLGVARGLAEYRALGNAITPSAIVSRHGALSITTQVGPLSKIQAVAERAGPFQRRLDLGSLDVHVAGPGARLTIRDAGRTRVSALRAALATSAARGG